jgi:uncharacterized protein (DUF697 family)
MDDKTPQTIQPKQPANSPTSVSEVEVKVQTSTAERQPVKKPPAPEKDGTSFLTSFAHKVGKVGGTVTGTATQTGKAIAGLGEAAAQRTLNLISQATQGAGQTVTYVGNNWLVRRLTRFLNLGWLVGATDNVDLAKAEAAVRKLQQEHPNDPPSQIAHRIMVDKATRAGGIGLASSILPGAALALLAVDLAATMQLQAEMVYQIAAAYGLELQDPARKGEVLGIFGLGLGGGKLMRAAGLGLLRNIPFAGAVIGASSNSAMLYSLGYAACRFYEVKQKSPAAVTTEETLADLKKQSENYLETAIAQQAVMDQILVHMILASHPEKSWKEILPEVKALNLSPTSLKAIAANIKSPQPLDALLDQLNRDFAVPLLAQCYRIALADGFKTAEETRVIEAIANKFDIDLNSIKSAVQSET